ncbi:MAG: EAL domain-containing protein, partial [Panacagrimonas sp.]
GSLGITKLRRPRLAWRDFGLATQRLFICQQTLAQLGAGELVGEMALIDGRPRSAAARAVTDLRLRVVTFEHLNERLGAADPLLRLLLRVLLARYRDVLAPGSQRPLAPDDDDRRAALDRLQIEHDLSLAIERGEFQLLYQPIIRLRDLRTAGFEALIRWHSPTRGFVSPAAFIPLAEESGQIIAFGAWVMQRSCAALTRLAAQDDSFLAINLSSRQLKDADIDTTLHQAAKAADVAPHRIKLEVTESFLMDDFEAATAVLARQRDAGFRIAIDDFGTGYSSLSYLHRLPVDTLKIDQSFIQRIGADQVSHKIVAAIGELTQKLGMNVVAEGVETAEQAMAVRDMGFEYAQGYYFSRPVTEAQAAELVARPWTINSASTPR